MRKKAREMINKTTKIKNIILATPAKAAAIPVKPKTAATNDKTNSIIARLNIMHSRK